MEAYNKASDGLGTGLMEAFKEQLAANERELIRAHERALMDGAIHKRAQWFALAFSAASLGVTLVAILVKAEWAASIIGGGTIAAVVAAFLRAPVRKP